MRKSLHLLLRKVFVTTFLVLYTFAPSVSAVDLVSEEDSSEDTVTPISEEDTGDILEEGISDPEYIANPEVIPEFTFENDIYTVTSVEEKEYVYPGDQNVRIEFTKITEEGDLVIKKVSLSEEEKEELNTSENYAWDFTSSMSNGSFSYNLTLPNTQDGEVKVVYTEDGDSYTDVDSTVNENLIHIYGLDHFTMFVVVDYINYRYPDFDWHLRTEEWNMSKTGAGKISFEEGYGLVSKEGRSLGLGSDYIKMERRNTGRTYLGFDIFDSTLWSGFGPKLSETLLDEISWQTFSVNNPSDHYLNIYLVKHTGLFPKTATIVYVPGNTSSGQWNTYSTNLPGNWHVRKDGNLTHYSSFQDILTDYADWRIYPDTQVGSGIAIISGSSGNGVGFENYVDNVKLHYTNGATDTYLFEDTEDEANPTVTISSPEPSPTKNPSIPITITFNEDVYELDGTSLVFTNATHSGFNKISQSEYEVNLEPISTGSVSISVPAGIVFDSSGNPNESGSFSIFFDNTPPTATINGLAPESIYNGNENIKVHAVDTNYSRTEFYKESSASPFKTYTEARFGISWLAEGNYRMIVIDMADNSTEYAFTIDKTAPATPELVFPADNQYINAEDLYINWNEATDNYTDQSDIVYEYRLYSKDPNTYPNASSFKVFYTGTTRHPSAGFASGTGEHEYWYTVRAIDEVGNNSTFAPYKKFTVDNSNPAGSIDGIKYPNGTVQDKFVTNLNTPVLVGSANDNNSVKSVEVKVGTYASSSISLDSGNWEAGFSDPIPDGTYTVELTITDLADNVTVVTGDITIDTLAPTAQHKYFKNGTEITNPTAYVKRVNELTFTGKYYDANPSSGLYWDSFVIFEAQDDGSFRFSTNGKRSFCGWRTSPNLIDLSIYDGETRNFTDCIDTLPDGNYYMAHHIYDNATRKDIPSINQFRDVLGLNFIVDTTVPSSSFTPDISGTSHNGPITLEGTTTDDNGVDYVDLYYKPQGSTESGIHITTLTNDTKDSPFDWTFDWTPPTEGTYDVFVSGTDLAGNIERTAYLYDITFDLTAPVITLLSPEDNFYTNQTSFVQTWTSEDTDIDHYEYRSCSNNPNGEEECNKIYKTNRNSTSRTVNNSNIIFWWQVRGVDEAGNPGEWTSARKATMDNIAPEVEITSHNDGQLVRGIQTITGEVEDLNLSHYWFVVHNSSGQQVGGPGVVHNSRPDVEPTFDWDTTGLDDGIYTIKLEARDLADNKDGGSVHWVQVEVDNTAPIITITSPTEEESYYGTLDLQAVCNEECDYINFWWRAEGEEYSNVSPDRRYHYEHDNGTLFNWDLDTLNAERWNGDPSYIMEDGTYYIKAAGKDLAGNWAGTDEIKIYIDNTIPTAEVISSIVKSESDTVERFIQLLDNMGLSQACYDLGDGEVCQTVNGLTYDWNVSSILNSLGIGNYTFGYWLFDLAGNRSDAEIEIEGDDDYSFEVSVQEDEEEETEEEDGDDGNGVVLGATDENNEETSNPTYYSYQPLGIGGPEEPNTEDTPEEEQVNEEEEKDLDEDSEEEVKGTETGNEEDEEKEGRTINWVLYILLSLPLLILIYLILKRRNEEDER